MVKGSDRNKSSQSKIEENEYDGPTILELMADDIYNFPGPVPLDGPLGILRIEVKKALLTTSDNSPDESGDDNFESRIYRDSVLG